MIRALAKLTWLEIKIFVREPLGVVGTVGIPVLVFVVMTRLLGTTQPSVPRSGFPGSSFVPVLTAILIALSGVVSLIAIISIYREGGILKRLRATPLPPVVILTAHVLVKLIFTTITLAAMLLAGRRYFPPNSRASQAMILAKIEGSGAGMGESSGVTKMVGVTGTGVSVAGEIAVAVVVGDGMVVGGAAVTASPSVTQSALPESVKVSPGIGMNSRS